MDLKYFACCIGLFLMACGAPDVTPIDESDQYFRRDGDFAASHVLIAFHGATGASEDIVRSQDEAAEKAREMVARLLVDPQQFEELARTASDGTSAQRGGDLGAWSRGAFLPEFEAAVEAMMVGEIRAEPLLSEYGYHVIRRNALETMHYSAQGFFISFKGHPLNPPQVHRSKEEAEALAQSLKGKVTANNFAEMAAEHNDLGDGPQFLGIIRPGDPFPAEALDTLAGLAYGEVGGPVAFPMGYAFMRREKVVRYRGQGILLAYQGARDAQITQTRSKEEAASKAQELIDRLKQDPASFGALALEHSDSPLASKEGHWTMFRGEMEPSFRAALEALEIDRFTQEPVETPYGYYIIKRLPQP